MCENQPFQLIVVAEFSDAMEECVQSVLASDIFNFLKYA